MWCAGQFGCPQTRDRLIVLATLNGLETLELPEPVHAKYKHDEDALVRAFDESNTSYPIPVDVEKPLMRSLVLGDSLSCDLPIEAAEFRVCVPCVCQALILECVDVACSVRACL